MQMMAGEDLVAVLFEPLKAVGFLLLAFVTVVGLSALQERIGLQAMRAGNRYYRGGARGWRTDAEWFVKTLLMKEEQKEKTKVSGDSGLSAIRPLSLGGIPPEWENKYSSRLLAYERDIEGKTAQISTADMISTGWDLPLCVCMELGLFADLIVRDFVLYWYNESISKEPQFPDDVRSVLHTVLGKLGDRILSINLPMFLLCDLSYVLRHHLRWFSELRERARKRCHPVEEFDQISQEDRNKLVLEEFRRAGHLHPACSITGELEDPRTHAYIRSITSELLVRLLPEQDFQCAALRHLVREVLTCNVLVPALESITPDVFNSAILHGLRGSENPSDEGESAQEPLADSGSHHENPTSSPSPQPSTESKVHENEESGAGQRSDKELKEDSSVDLDKRLKKEEEENVSTIRMQHRRELDDEKCTESIDFIQRANSEMRKEESVRLFVELKTVVSECTTNRTSSDSPLTEENSCARQLLRVFDLVLEHGLADRQNYSTVERFSSADEEGSRRQDRIRCEPWWEYVRRVAELVPDASTTTEMIDDVFETLFIDGDSPEESVKSEEPSSKSGRISPLRDSSRIREDLLHLQRDLAALGQRISSRRSSISEKHMPQSDRDILEPGKAWLALMLKHRLLDTVIEALLSDGTWTDLHYEETSTIRMKEIVPLLATLNEVDFDFNLDMFWQQARKIKKRLERGGDKSARLQKLKRFRKRAAELAAKVRRRKKRATSGVSEQTLLSLQDRVGPIRATITDFSTANERGGVRSSSFVQYTVKCEITRREDEKISSWIVHRRYSQFHDLHGALKTRFGYRFDDVSIPKKSRLFESQTESFITKRRAELEAYLQKVLGHPTVADSEEVLHFLSPQTESDLGPDDLLSDDEKDLPDPLLPRITSNERDRRKVMSSPGVEAETKEEPQVFVTPKSKPARSKSRTPSPSRRAKGNMRDREQESNKDPKIDPYELRIAEGHLYKLAQEIFEFHELDIVRRNLISVMRNVISLVFRGTAHRWLKDNYTRNASAELLAQMLGTVRELLWPDGTFMETEDARELSPEERALIEKNRKDCLEELLKAVPPQMITFLGKSKSYGCCHKLHEFLQHPSLIHNLVFTTMDLLLLRIFPDLPLKDLHHRSNEKNPPI